MTAKGFYDEKRSSTKPAANSFSAAASRATRAPRLQSEAPQREKREKSPSELGEEVLAMVLEEDLPKARQTAGGAQTANTKTAMGSQKAVQYGGFTEKPAAGNRKTSPYGSGFTAAADGNRKAAPYGSGFTAAAAGNRKAAPYDSGFTAAADGQGESPRRVQPAAGTDTFLSGFTATGTGVFMPDFTAADMGTFTPGFTAAGTGTFTPDFTAAGTGAFTPDFTAAGLSDAAILGAQWGNGIADAMLGIGERSDALRATPEWQAQAAAQDLSDAGLDAAAQQGLAYGDSLFRLDQKAEALRATPEWQAQAAAQDLSYAGLDANAQLGLGYGDGLFRLDQKLDEMTAPIRATPEWQAVAESQQLSGLGLDTAAQMGYDIGQPIGAWASQLVDDTYLAPGTSFGDYLGDRFKSGMWSGIEGAWNSLIDLGEGAARNDLMMQDFERQQYAFLGERYRRNAELNGMWTEQVLEGLPQAAEGMRSHRAAEYAQYIDELYGAGGLYRLGGDIASSVGQMVPTILTNVLTGGSGGMAYLYASASGNAAAEARARGADEETALLYGILSGGVEVGTEQLGGGIPGLNKGVLDDWLMGMAQSSTGRAALKYAVNALGEGAEEFISGIAGAYLAKMWNGDERGFWQTLGEALPDAFYEGLVGTLTSALMSLPGSIAEIGDAYTVDMALNGIKNGETLSSVQPAAEAKTDPTASTASPEALAEQNAGIRRYALERGKAKGIELDTAERLAKTTGLKLRYIYDEGSGVDGFVHGDTVTVNLAGEASAFCVAVHETAHSMKVGDAKKFDAFQQSVQRILESNSELNQYAQQVRAAYLAEGSPALAGLTNADGTIDTAALEEDVCLKTFERLIGDPETLTQAVAHDRTVIESFLDVLRGIKNSLVIKLTGSEKAMLDEAERTLTNLLRGEAGIVEGERFSYVGEKANLNALERENLSGAKEFDRIITKSNADPRHSLLTAGEMDQVRRLLLTNDVDRVRTMLLNNSSEQVRRQLSGLDGGQIHDLLLRLSPEQIYNLFLTKDQSSSMRELNRRDRNWFIAPDEKWRMEVDDSKAQFSSGGTARGAAVLGERKVKDFLIHPELERLEPILFDVPMRIDPTMMFPSNGKYEGKNKGISLRTSGQRTTAFHEMQHGIGEIEGFADGSNTKKGAQWALLEAYENVKDTPAYRALRDKKSRYQFVVEEACRRAGVDNLKDAAKQYYEKAAGEVEARDVTNRLKYSAEKRKSQAPDLSGSVKYAQDPEKQFVDMLKAMGYTEGEID